MTSAINMLLQASAKPDANKTGHAMLSVDPGRLGDTANQAPDADSADNGHKGFGFAQIMQTRWQATLDEQQASDGDWDIQSQGFDAQLLLPQSETLTGQVQPIVAEAVLTSPYELAPFGGNELPPWGSEFPGSMQLAASAAAALQAQDADSDALLAVAQADSEALSMPEDDNSPTGLAEAGLEGLAPITLPAQEELDALFSDLAFLPVETLAEQNQEERVTKGDLAPASEEGTHWASQLIAALKAKQQASADAAVAQREGKQEETMALAASVKAAADQAGLRERRAMNRISDGEFAVSESSPGTRSGSVAAAVEVLLNRVGSSAEGHLERSDQNSLSSNSASPLLARGEERPLDSLASASERADNSLKIRVPINQPDWGARLGRQLTLLVSRQADVAQIQLEPPELGPLQVRLSVVNEQVSLQFLSPHAQVRDALEATVSRLQELFDEQGLDLVDVDVADDSDKERGQQGNESSQAGELEEAQGDGFLTARRATDLSDGKIDYFV